jgi:hypothetical protein
MQSFNPYQQQQPQTRTFTTMNRQGFGEQWWAVSGKDANGCQFAVLWASYMCIPLLPMKRSCIKIGKTTWSGGTRLKTCTIFYETPFVAKEILGFYLFVLLDLLATFVPLYLVSPYGLGYATDSALVGLMAFIWAFIPSLFLFFLYKRYTR